MVGVWSNTSRRQYPSNQTTNVQQLKLGAPQTSMSAPTAVFTLKLNHKVLARRVAVGKFDGIHPCLVAATNGNKVLIHTPHGVVNQSSAGRVLSSHADITLLSLSQYVTSLAVGQLDQSADSSSSSRDLLFVGSSTHLLAYDIHNNADLFYNEVPDGVNIIAIGPAQFGLPAGGGSQQQQQQLVYTGGNCSVTGFDSDGRDQYWTVTGDNVCSLAMVDYNADGYKELMVGSEDYDIRVFSGDELITELTEGDAIVSLCPLGGSKFAVALANGNLGVYSGATRLWRAKLKHYPICITNYDINNDGIDELITGWSNGRLDARHPDTGDVIFKDKLPSLIAGLVKADYLLDGREELICCTSDGEVRGYLPAVFTGETREKEGNELLQELSRHKANLIKEVERFDTFNSLLRSKDPMAQLTMADDNIGVIPASTAIRSDISTQQATDKRPAHLLLKLEMTNNTLIRMIVVFADGLFDGESCAIHPSTPKRIVSLPLYPSKDVAVNMFIKVYVGQSGSTQFHIFEVQKSLPRFSLYSPCSAPPTDQPPPGKVEFTIQERVQRIRKWFEDSFLNVPSSDHFTSSKHMEVSYLSLVTDTIFTMRMDSGKVTLLTDDIELAGNIIQALSEDLSIENLRSRADYPMSMDELKQVLEKVQELHQVREMLSTDMADHASMIRNLVMRAEDSRLLNNMSMMKKAHLQLSALNQEIVAGYEIRRNNHLELMEHLRIVNQTIKRAANLRVGKAKTVCTNACRAAIKTSDHDALVKAILTGSY